MGDLVDQVSRMLEKSNFLIFVLLSFAFGQEEAAFGCCPLKEVQGAGDLAGVYYLVDTDQPFPDACTMTTAHIRRKETETRSSVLHQAQDTLQHVWISEKVTPLELSLYLKQVVNLLQNPSL